MNIAKIKFELPRQSRRCHESVWSLGKGKRLDMSICCWNRNSCEFPDISSERLKVCRDRSPALEGSEVAARVCLLRPFFKRFERCKVRLSTFPTGTQYDCRLASGLMTRRAIQAGE